MKNSPIINGVKCCAMAELCSIVKGAEMSEKFGQNLLSQMSEKFGQTKNVTMNTLEKVNVLFANLPTDLQNEIKAVNTANDAINSIASLQISNSVLVADLFANCLSLIYEAETNNYTPKKGISPKTLERAATNTKDVICPIISAVYDQLGLIKMNKATTLQERLNVAKHYDLVKECVTYSEAILKANLLSSQAVKKQLATMFKDEITAKVNGDSEIKDEHKAYVIEAELKKLDMSPTNEQLEKAAELAKAEKDIEKAAKHDMAARAELIIQTEKAHQQTVTFDLNDKGRSTVSVTIDIREFKKPEDVIRSLAILFTTELGDSIVHSKISTALEAAKYNVQQLTK